MEAHVEGLLDAAGRRGVLGGGAARMAAGGVGGSRAGETLAKPAPQVELRAFRGAARAEEDDDDNTDEEDDGDDDKDVLDKSNLLRHRAMHRRRPRLSDTRAIAVTSMRSGLGGSKPPMPSRPATAGHVRVRGRGGDLVQGADDDGGTRTGGEDNTGARS